MTNQARRTAFLAARCALLLAPFLWTAVLVGRYGVDVPYSDQWEAEYPMFARMAQGTLGPGDFFAQHNEHRIFFPRLLFYTLAKFTHWNIRAELWLILGLALVISYNLWRVLRSTGWNLTGPGFWLFLAANVLMFSPLHRENMLWGFQVGFFLPLACLTACLWVGALESARARFAGVIALSLVCSFSVGGGFICWLLSVPLLAQAGGRETWTRHRVGWLAWAGGFAGSVALYFHGYVKPPQHPDGVAVPAPARGGPAILAHVPGASLRVRHGAGPVRRRANGGDSDAPPARGDARLPLAMARGRRIDAPLPAVAAARGDCRDQRHAHDRRPLWPGTLAGARVALRHLRHFPAAIGLSFVAAAIHQHLQARAPGAPAAGRAGAAFVSLASMLAILHGLGALNIAPGWKDFSASLLKSKALVETVNVTDEPELFARNVYALPLRHAINVLDKIGYLHPAPLSSKFIDRIADVSAPVTENFGKLEQAARGPDRGLTLTGWAVLPGKDRPADAVLLTSDDAAGRAVIFALAEVGTARPDVADARQDSSYLRSGWQIQGCANPARRQPGRARCERGASTRRQAAPTRCGAGSI